jgi:hypothetical protein
MINVFMSFPLLSKVPGIAHKAPAWIAMPLGSSVDK